MSGPPSPRDRHRARHAAVQMLYQWEVGKTPVDEVITTYWKIGDGAAAGDEPSPVPRLSADARDFAAALAIGVAAHVSEIDPYIADAAKNWRVSRMAVLDRLIMRLAVYEFLHAPDTPRAVVIDEALELTKQFSGDEAGSFVNGVLDAIRRRIDEPA